MKKITFAVLILITILIYSCATAATSAEEYFSIGMAYFELGKYEEAERWLNRALQFDRTMAASQYNLGRLAFEMGRYDESAQHFENILLKDPDNIFALRAAAYARIKTGEFDIAQKHYDRLLELVPENADDGYNHALVLYAMERYREAEQVLEKYIYSMQDNRELTLLYARTMSAQNKIEAVNIFSAWLNEGSDPKVRYEYALALEYHELYARAVEEYRMAISEVTSQTGNIKKSDIRFALARVLLIADGESAEGIIEMQNAVAEGFNETSAIEKLIESGKVTGVNLNSLKDLASSLRRGQMQNEEEDLETDSESRSQ